ncbi:MAG: aromatic ring-hydroxylating oxygenase subunit alpha, partial [Shinella sp.]
MNQDIVNRAHQLLKARKPDWSLEQPFYVDSDFFDMEMELFFTRQWLFAAMTCEIPATGDWIRVDIARESVIVLRKKDGQIAAYHNTCRHRGSRICLAERGRSNRLVCPYHQWSYELDGQLSRTRLMGEAFEKDGFGLVPVAVGVVGGYIFLNLSQKPPSFEPFRTAVESYLLPHDLDNAKVVHTQALVEKANWKLVIENNRECYHCAGSHPELMHIITEFDDPNDPKVSPDYKALLEKKGLDWDALGLPHVHTEGHLQYRAVRLPFTGGMLSMTMDGHPGCTKLLGNLTSPDLGSVRLLHLPNTWNHVLADHAVTFRVFPLNAEETLVTTKWLVHKDAVEDVDYHIPRLIEVWSKTNDQDRQLAENNHLGIRGRAYRSGPYSDVIEGGTRDFVRWYADE